MNDDFGFTYLLNELAKESKVAPSEIVRLAGQVSYQESKGSPTAVQIVSGGNTENPVTGPGRGMYQMEGADASNYTGDAVARLKRFYRAKGTVAPDWVQNLPENFDSAMLTPEQQMMLFMARNTKWGSSDKDFKGTTFADISKKDFDPVDWWAKYHKRSGVTPEEKSRMYAEQNIRKNNVSKYVSADELFGTPEYFNRFGGYTDIT